MKYYNLFHIKEKKFVTASYRYKFIEYEHDKPPEIFDELDARMHTLNFPYLRKIKIAEPDISYPPVNLLKWYNDKYEDMMKLVQEKSKEMRELKNHIKERCGEIDRLKDLLYNPRQETSIGWGINLQTLGEEHWAGKALGWPKDCPAVHKDDNWKVCRTCKDLTAPPPKCKKEIDKVKYGFWFHHSPCMREPIIEKPKMRGPVEYIEQKYVLKIKDKNLFFIKNSAFNFNYVTTKRKQAKRFTREQALKIAKKYPGLILQELKRGRK